MLVSSSRRISHALAPAHSHRRPTPMNLKSTGFLCEISPHLLSVDLSSEAQTTNLQI